MLTVKQHDPLFQRYMYLKCNITNITTNMAVLHRRNGFYMALCVFISINLVKSAPMGCDSNIDLLFIVDASESIIADDPYGKPLQQWSEIKQFLRGVVKNMPISYHEAHMGMLKYSDNTHLEFTMQQEQYYDLPTIDAHIRDKLIHVGGNTNTAGALEQAINYLFNPTYGARQNTRPIVVLLTDGISNRNKGFTVQRAQDLKNYGAEIFVIAMGTDIDETELESIATGPDHFVVQSFANDLNRLIEYSVYKICNLPLPTPAPPNCDVNMDLAIVIDNSGSIKNESTQSTENRNYDNLKNFITSLLDILEIGQDQTRVGVVRFSDRASTVFKLNRFYDRASMKTAIQNMPFDGGLTNISGALKQIDKDLFRSYNGDRPDVRNVVIVIADGESNVDPELTSQAANRLKVGDTRLYVVAVLTTKFDETELKDIASDPDADHYFNSPSINNLPAIRYSLLKHVCEQDTLQGGVQVLQPLIPPGFSTN